MVLYTSRSPEDLGVASRVLPRGTRTLAELLGLKGERPVAYQLSASLADLEQALGRTDGEGMGIRLTQPTLSPGDELNVSTDGKLFKHFVVRDHA